MPCEFDCCECPAHVIRYDLDAPPVPPLCGTCLWMPGWQSVPELREIFGDGYDVADGAQQGRSDPKNDDSP